MNKNIEKRYVHLVETFDTNLLGFMAGIVSGIAINIATGGNLNGYAWLGIVCLSIAVFFILRLIRVRQAVDQQYKWRENIKGIDHNEAWKASVDPDDTQRVKKYCWAIILLLGSVIMGIWMINLSKNKPGCEGDCLQKILQKQQQQLNDMKRIMLQHSTLIQPVKDSVVQRRGQGEIKKATH